MNKKLKKNRLNIFDKKLKKKVEKVRQNIFDKKKLKKKKLKKIRQNISLIKIQICTVPNFKYGFS